MDYRVSHLSGQPNQSVERADKPLPPRQTAGAHLLILLLQQQPSVLVTYCLHVSNVTSGHSVPTTCVNTKSAVLSNYCFLTFPCKSYPDALQPLLHNPLPAIASIYLFYLFILPCGACSKSHTRTSGTYYFSSALFPRSNTTRAILFQDITFHFGSVLFVLSYHLVGANPTPTAGKAHIHYC